MNTYSKNISQTTLESGIVKCEYQSISSGSCQCFKDCDCSLDRGKVLGSFFRYKNGLKYIGTLKEKTYDTEESAIKALINFNNSKTSKKYVKEQN